MKECIKCHETFPLTEQFFGRRNESPDGFRNECKACVKKRRDAWHQMNRQDQLRKMKEYRAENIESLLALKREYNKRNRDVMVSKARSYYKENRLKVLSQMKEHWASHREEISQMRKKRYRENYEENMRKKAEYISKNRERIRRRQAEYCTNRRKNDPQYRMSTNLRTRISLALRKTNKHERTMALIGCTVQELRNYLAKLFRPGMSWGNYGQWHIDHIVPCSVFNLADPYEQKVCFHYSNLQPLWSIDNLKKANKIPTPEQMKERMAL